MQRVNEKVAVERDGDVLVVLIDNPPINAGSLAVRRGVRDAMAMLAEDPALRAAVLIGQGTTFIAGSDLREFGQPLEEPQLPAVILAVERVAKPVVAALHGAALGGGFELALGCDARIAAPGTVVGLPEVTLGMIPGAGGSQRLPRLVGVSRAITLVCSGERLKADAALALGIVDAVADGDLRAAAVQLAGSLAGKRRLRDRPVPAEAPQAIASAAALALKKGRGRPNVQAAIEMVQAAVATPIDEALARERELFQRFRMSADAAALRHLFFAEREAGRAPDAESAALRPRPLSRASVVGGGHMGRGIAICLAEAGIAVQLVEVDDAAALSCRERLDADWAAGVASGRCSADKAAAAAARVAVGTDWQALADCGLVVEAVVEDLAAKLDVFRRLDGLLEPGAVIASNTSYLDLDALAAATARPQDVIGLHFFSPAPAMKLLEIVRGARTGAPTLATALALARQLGKQPVIAGNAFGVVGNRVFDAYRRQCEFMVEEGARPEQVDAALEDFGFAMGPFAVADLSGLDIAWRMRRARAAERDPSVRQPTVADRLCEAGRLGRKTGAGWYRHEAGARRGVPDPRVQAIVEQARAALGIAPRSVDAAEIVRRALAAMANEAALLIADGVAARPGDIDVALGHGYGFPRWAGGPVHWARCRGVPALQGDIDELARHGGAGFVRGDPARLV